MYHLYIRLEKRIILTLLIIFKFEGIVINGKCFQNCHNLTDMIISLSINEIKNYDFFGIDTIFCNIIRNRCF